MRQWYRSEKTCFHVILNKRLYYQQHHFSFPLHFISDFLCSLPESLLLCFLLFSNSSSPRSSQLVACCGGHAGSQPAGTLPGPTFHQHSSSLLPPEVLTSLHSWSQTLILYCYQPVSVNLLQQVPEITPAIAFVTTVGRFFHYLHAAHLGTIAWACFHY